MYDEVGDSYFEKPRVDGRGGARKGAGRKKGSSSKDHQDYIKAKTEHEQYKAASVKLDYEIKCGKYVLRTQVEEAAAVAFATVCQNLRSMPDNLERKIGLNPEIAEEIAQGIDEILSDLSEQLEKLHKDNMPEILDLRDLESNDDD